MATIGTRIVKLVLVFFLIRIAHENVWSLMYLVGKYMFQRSGKNLLDFLLCA